MSTIDVILDTQADGTVHVPVPAELRHGKVRIQAVLEPVETNASAERRVGLLAAMEAVAQGNPFSGIADPVAWQREIRADKVTEARD